MVVFLCYNYHMLSLIKKIYYDNYGVYGARRIFEIIKNKGYHVSYKTIYDYCHKASLISVGEKVKNLKIKKPVKTYIKIGTSNKCKIIKLYPRTINEVWVSDWTRFFIDDSIIYVYFIMDLFSRRIIGYGFNMVGEIVETQVEVLKKTIIDRNPSDNLTIHSDNEITNFREEMKLIVERVGIKQTFNIVMSNNNYMESFVATFYKEFYRGSFITDYFIKKLTFDNLEIQLKRYINFYNNKRAHSSLGYITPRQYESTIRTYIPIKYQRQILHIDINACFAQYECLLNPSLKGKNLVVIGEEYKRDRIIVCASLEARKYGIGCGDSLRYARFKCPNLIVRRSSKKKYGEISQKFFEILYHYSDRVEPYGIDEAWVDVTHSTLLFGSPLRIAELIMNEVKQEMGITVSVGISFNKVFSKLASDIHKPNAITHIPYKYFRKLLYDRSVEELLFVGNKTKELLNMDGIRTIGDLAFAKFASVRALVGEKWAYKLINYANGQEFAEVRKYGETERPKTMSKSDTLYENAKTISDLKPVIYRLSADLGARLRDANLFAYGLVVKLRDKYYKDYSMQMQICYGVSSGIEIADEIMRLIYKNWYGIEESRNVDNLMSLKKYYELNDKKLKFEVRQVCVGAFNLQNYENPKIGQNSKYKNVEKAIDTLNKKYNDRVVFVVNMSEPWYNQYQ